MRRLPLVLGLACLGALPIRLSAASPLELPVWDGVAPGSEGQSAAETAQERGHGGVHDRALRRVHTPTLTVYLPEKGRATGVAILIAPGGGYEHLTIDKEGGDIARRFLADGIAGIVLKYRLPRTPGTKYTADTALADAVQGLKVIRAHAAEWGLDPAKVGMMGFSAGGNLGALASTRPPAAERPSFLAFIYGVVPANFGPVPPDVPPTFIAQANDTPIGPDNSLRLYGWVSARHVPVEVHLFTRGGHGFGLGRPGSSAAEWPGLFVQWLAETGFLPDRAGRTRPASGPEAY